MRVAASWVIGLHLLGGCSGCRGGEQAAPAGDAGDASAVLDTARLDVATEFDSRLDLDGGSDSAASLDAKGGYGPFVGEWNPLPGVSKCLFLVAATPKESVSPLKWTACPSGRPGCKLAVTDWSSVGNWRISAAGEMRTVAGKLYFPHVRRYPDPVDPYSRIQYALIVIERVDDGVVMALGDDDTRSKEIVPCGGGPTFGELGIVVRAPFATDIAVAYSSWSAPTSFTTRYLAYSDLLLGGTKKTTGFNAVSGGALFMATSSPTGIAVYDPISGEIRTKGKASLVAGDPIAVDGGAIAMHGAPGGLDFFGDDASMSAAVRPPAGRWDVGHAIDRARADAIVWVETDVDTYAKPELWETPFTKTTADAKPRRAASLSFVPDNLVANAGMALMTSIKDTSKATLVRLADGAQWTVSPEPGDQFYAPLWVDDTEVWLFVAKAPWERIFTYSVLRLARSSLGAPTLP